MRTAVVTSTIGIQPEYATITMRYMQAYAAKIGADFVRIVSGSNYNPYYALHANLWLFDVYDRLIVLDADILVKPECPDLAELCVADMGVVFEHRDDESVRAHYLIAERLYGKLHEGDFARWKEQYFNSGVLILHQKHKHLFDVPPELTWQTHEAVSSQADQNGGDQTMLNYRVLVTKTPVVDMGSRCNRAFFRSFKDVDRDTAYMLHYNGNSKPVIVDDILKLEPALSPAALYLVFAMRRTGHHAIMNWMAQQHGSMRIVEDTQILNGKFVYNPEVVVGDTPRAMLFNLEDVGDLDFNDKWWPMIRERWGMKYPQIIPVVIVRDAYNWQASTYQKWLNWPKNPEWEPWRVPGHQHARIGTWRTHVRHYLKGVAPGGLGPMVGISYNKWCVDEQYRRAIAAALRIPFTDAGFDQLPGHSGGSSFTRMTVPPTKMSVNGRYKQVELPGDILDTLAKDRTQELQRAAFPDAPTKETMTTATQEPPALGAYPDLAELANIARNVDNNRPLNIMTICKADDWVYDRLPRFLGMINLNAKTPTKKHLLLLVEEDKISVGERDHMVTCLEKLFDQVVVAAYEDPYPGKRLLYFDKLRSTLLTIFGLTEGLYMDPDTDVVRPLDALIHFAPQAKLLWVANPVPVAAVMGDLNKHAFFVPIATPQTYAEHPLMEAGFIYMRQDFLVQFEDMQRQFPNLDPFMPGSTYWNMVMQRLPMHDRHRLPDDFNRTFWDIPGCVTWARTVHFTGQWKHLQPYVNYEDGNKIVLYGQPFEFPETRIPRYERPALS